MSDRSSWFCHHFDESVNQRNYARKFYYKLHFPNPIDYNYNYKRTVAEIPEDTIKHTSCYFSKAQLIQ